MTTKRRGPVKSVEFPSSARMMPATQGMLRLVRDELVQKIDASEERSIARDDELRADIAELRGEVRALDAKVDALEAKIDAKVATLDAKIDALEAKIDARFSALEAKIDAQEHRHRAELQEIRALVTQHLALNEEQTAQNGIALEAVTGMIQRQNRLENTLNELRDLVYEFVRSNRAR